MCVIIDVNLAFRIFTSVPEADFRPVFDWLHAPDKNGCVVFGGKLLKELSSREASRRYLLVLLRAGRAYRIPDAMVQGPYARTTRRCIMISAIPSSSQSLADACIKTPRIRISSAMTLLAPGDP